MGLPYPVSAAHPMFDSERQWIDPIDTLRTFTGQDDDDELIRALSDIVSDGAHGQNPKLLRALSSTFVNWPKPGPVYGGMQFGFKGSVKVHFELRDGDGEGKSAAYEAVSREIPYLYMSGVNDEGRCVFWGQMACPATEESILKDGLSIAVDRHYSVGVFTLSSVPQVR